MIDDVDEQPDLSVEIIEDDELLAAAVDAIVLRDPEARRLHHEIAIVEEMFKDLTGSSEWNLYLRIDELRGARSADLLVVVARWAFTAGVRSAERPRRPT